MNNGELGRNHLSLEAVRGHSMLSRAMQVLLSFSIILAIVSAAQAGCSVSTGCRAESDWDPSAFLSTDEVPGMSMTDVRPGMTAGSSFSVLTVDEARSRSNKSAGAVEGLQGAQAKPVYRSDQFANGRMLGPLLSISGSDVVLDASNGSRYDRSHIKDAIHLPANGFINDSGGLRGVQEMASIMGHAGISRDDSVVVYSDRLASGDATFVLWVLKYLGHDDVRLLDGSLDDYIAMGLPVESSIQRRSKVDYMPRVKQDLLASYSLVKNGSVQVVYAGTPEDLGMDSISGSIFMDPVRIVDGGRLMDSKGLNETFSGFDKGRPVAIYSEDGVKASLIWYAMQLFGYDSRLYI